MNSFVIIAMIGAMLSVGVVMGLGIFSMAKGGAFNEKYGNKIMQLRVWLQGLTLALLALAFFLSQN